jgi:hypothetical protein
MEVFFKGSKAHLRGVSSETRVIRNYIKALGVKTPDGKNAVSRVERVYIPTVKIDEEKTTVSGRVVTRAKTETELPSSTVELLRKVSGEGLFDLVEINSAGEAQKAADDLNIDRQDFMNVLMGSSLLFVSEWSGKSVSDFMKKYVNDEKVLKEFGRKLGGALKSLHKEGVICGDTHLGQFVVKGPADEVIRVDLVNIYMVEECGVKDLDTEYHFLSNQLTLIKDAFEGFKEGYREEELNAVKCVSG